MSEYTFSSAPSVSIPRTKFHRSFTHNVSFNLGEIVVLACDEVIPGSTHKLEFGSLVRMSTPIAPIMDDIQMDLYSFFVPLRLTWVNFKRFMGENTTGSGKINEINSDKTIPMISSVYGSYVNTIADDLGIPPYVSGNQPGSISVLPFRAVDLIYNRWFRNQNVQAPITVLTGDSAIQSSSDLAHYGLASSGGGITPEGRLIAYKLPDYFTSALPYAQKGNPVNLFGKDARVSIGVTWSGSGGANMPYSLTNQTNVSGSFNGLVATSNGGAGSSGPLVGNLSTAYGATINDLRFAFQLQKFLEKDALYGSRYWEILHAHYAVTSPDATLQDPELLGHIKYDINIQQVLQTTGFVDPSNTNLGTPGANSVTGKNGHLATFSAVEHGYLITLGVARQKRHTYSQGLNRMWSRKSRTDFYFPVFANIGAQQVLNKEIFAFTSTGDNAFGFQEAWAEYRFLPSYNSGIMNPVRPNSLDYWTLADKYASTPTLTLSFLKESRDNLARALVTGSGGPDFIGSFYFKDTCVNPMPLYSIPGFADHH